ncbi:MAG: hypothetical protein IJM00_02775 [Bacteroidales bacterium]|nr:hypothetical protein [Bacteroidales bacterium]
MVWVNSSKVIAFRKSHIAATNPTARSRPRMIISLALIALISLIALIEQISLVALIALISPI